MRKIGPRAVSCCSTFAIPITLACALIDASVVEPGDVGIERVRKLFEESRCGRRSVLPRPDSAGQASERLRKLGLRITRTNARFLDPIAELIRCAHGDPLSRPRM